MNLKVFLTQDADFATDKLHLFSQRHQARGGDAIIISNKNVHYFFLSCC